MRLILNRIRAILREGSQVTGGLVDTKLATSLAIR